MAVPLDIQVKNAGGVIRGKLVKTVSKKSLNGVVVTESSFQLLEAAGIPSEEIVNRNNFKILYPGGTWQGIVYKVSGTPNFKKNEEVVLFVNKGRYGYQLVNLGLSKYIVVQSPSGIFIRNSIFPQHPKLGKISLARLNKLLESKFGSPLAPIGQDKYVYKGIHLDHLKAKKIE